MQKYLKLLFQIIITLLIFWWIVKNISLLDLWHTILLTNKWLLSLSGLLGIYCVIVSAQQWQVLLKGTGYNVKISILTSLYLVGITFNQFLPTGLGGDVVKVALLRRITLTGTTSARSVVAARLTGFVGMLLAALVVAALRFPLFRLDMLTLLVCMAISYFLVLAIVFHPVTVLLSERAVKRFPRLKLNKIYEVQKAISDYRSNMRALLSAVGVGMFFWICTIINHYILARAVGIDISLWYFFVFIPIALTLSMVPISVNGFGVREGMFALLFSTAHVPISLAVTLALLMDIEAILLAVVGGVLFLLKERFLPKTSLSVSALSTYDDIVRLSTIKMSSLLVRDIATFDTIQTPTVLKHHSLREYIAKGQILVK